MPLTSDQVHRIIEDLLLNGTASTMHEAETLFLDTYLDQISQLVNQLDESMLIEHEAIKLLMAHGSRPWEDALQ